MCDREKERRDALARETRKARERFAFLLFSLFQLLSYSSFFSRLRPTSLGFPPPLDTPRRSAPAPCTSQLSLAEAFVAEKQTLENTIKTDVENTSYLSHTTVGARVRPLLAQKPFLVGGFFNTAAFGAVMAYARLHEHQRYLAEKREKDAAANAKPKSRQERPRAEADRSKEISKTRRRAEEAVRAMGGGARAFVEKGAKVA